MVVVFGWVFVGVIVAALEKSMRSGRDTDDTMVTILCVAGAVAGGFSGQTFRWYVFGEPLGFVFSVGGAELLVFFYRSRNAAIRAGGGVARLVAVAPPRPASPVAPETPPGMKFVEAFEWGVLCGLAAAVSGFFSHLVGGRLYPQRYEQIPSDFVFVPLGLIVGFVSAVTARLTRPQWTINRMFAIVALVAIAYAGVMFNFARGNAIPARLTVALEPEPATAVSCDPATCLQGDRPLRWTVQGYVRVQETSGLGGIVEAIELMSYEETPHRPHTFTREEAAETSKSAGPRVRLTGRQIIGARHVRPNEIVSYPIRYNYGTAAGDSLRSVSVYVEFTDAAGRPEVGIGQWHVR